MRVGTRARTFVFAMARRSTPPDLFGHRRPEQIDLFPEPEPVAAPTHAERARTRLLTWIAELRAAAVTLPWDAELARGKASLAPQIAEWLPEGEARELVGAFTAEYTRLGGLPPA